MAVLARKIARAKWQQKQDLGDDEIAADAITVDLRTTGNTLSFWRCGSTAGDDLRGAALALAAGAERVDRLDAIYLDEERIREAGLGTKDTPGGTPVASLRDHHVDVERLDLVRLGTVARLVFEAHRSDAVFSMTKKEVLDLVVGAVKGKVVALEELKDEVRAKVEAKLKEAK